MTSTQQGESTAKAQAGPRAAKDIARETDTRIAARLLDRESSGTRRVRIAGWIGAAIALVWLALWIALGEAWFTMVCGLFPALLAAAVWGVAVWLRTQSRNQRRRGRERLAASIEAQAAAPAGLPLSKFQVVGSAPIPEVVGAFWASPIEVADLVRSVTVFPIAIVLDVDEDPARDAHLQALLEQAQLGASGQKSMSAAEILTETLSLAQRQRERRSPEIAIGDLARVHVAIDNDVAPVIHLLFRVSSDARMRVYSFALADVADLPRFLATVKGLIPAERFIIPDASVWRVQP